MCLGCLGLGLRFEVGVWRGYDACGCKWCFKEAHTRPRHNHIATPPTLSSNVTPMHISSSMYRCCSASTPLVGVLLVVLLEAKHRSRRRAAVLAPADGTTKAAAVDPLCVGWIKQSSLKSIHKSIERSINPPTHQPTNQPINPPINHQSIDRSTEKPEFG